MSKPNNPPAFPLSMVVHDNQLAASGEPQDHGMTLRDYFAAAVMQGLVSCPDIRLESFGEYASRAYAQADAMLALREKGQQ